jgi:hypothetical protein
VCAKNVNREGGVGVLRDPVAEADTDAETDTGAAAEGVAVSKGVNLEELSHGTVIGGSAAVGVWYVQMPPAFTLEV